MIHSLLEIGPHVTAIPVVHGSGDFAWEVRRLMGLHSFDCLAVPLPASFQPQVERAILDLPVPSLVVQPDSPEFISAKWQVPGEFDEPGFDDSDNDDSDEYEMEDPGVSFVPIDPCQPVIAAIRTAMGEHIPRRFIDLETGHFEVHSRILPDAYALKKVNIEKFAAAVAPHLRPPASNQWHRRMACMAWHLRELSIDFRKILLVCSVLDWPWIRAAFNDRNLPRPEHDETNGTAHYQIRPETLYFALGELPFITDLYEQARSRISDDANLAIDGVKELLISARTDYRRDYRNRARKITPKLLSQCLRYIRNLTLIEHRLTPQLATIVTAAQQIAGDGYALHVLEKAKQYRYQRDLELPEVRVGVNRIAFPDGDILTRVSRLPGPPVTWSTLQLIPKPDEGQRQDWQQKWNPLSQCSWPPEDELIENFRSAVFDRAREVMGQDLAKTEKFTTSIKDGIDIRETVRHWYDGEIYVKVLPPARGKLDCCVILFDTPADPRDYRWRTTWFAEHQNESTLAFYASDYRSEPVGPGICLANYGGALFIYPPVAIPDIWQDTRLDFASTLEERLLAAACLHSECPNIALVSPGLPGPAWRMLARQYKKTWVHLPLSRFSDETVQQLRMVHVLNGKHVRSYAADFIRRA